MSKEVFEILSENALTIAFAESMTGGYASYQVIKNPGASNVTKGSIVAYNDEVKNSMLGVDLKTIKKFSVVSEEVALEMARGVKRIFDSNIGVGVTGNAGPTTQENTVGQIACIGIIIDDKEYSFKVEYFDEDRIKVIKKCTSFIFDKLHELLTR